MHLQKWSWIIVATKKSRNILSFHLYNVNVKKKLAIVFQKLQKFPNHKIWGKKNIVLDISI
jgi:hypothetical protein